MTWDSSQAQNDIELRITEYTRVMMYYVYILTNKSNSVLYTGVTNNIERRLYEHRYTPSGFVKRYNTNKLVYFECTDCVDSAIEREKQIKGWVRSKKEELIRGINAEWRDLSEDWKG